MHHAPQCVVSHARSICPGPVHKSFVDSVLLLLLLRRQSAAVLPIIVSLVMLAGVVQLVCPQMFIHIARSCVVHGDKPTKKKEFERPCI